MKRSRAVDGNRLKMSKSIKRWFSYRQTVVQYPRGASDIVNQTHSLHYEARKEHAKGPLKSSKTYKGDTSMMTVSSTAWCT